MSSDFFNTDVCNKVTKTITDTGVSCLDSQAELFKVLESCGVSPFRTGSSGTAENCGLTEPVFASILVAMINWADLATDETVVYNLVNQIPKLMENLVAFLKDYIAQLNWKQVIKLLDRPGIHFKVPETILIPVLAYRFLFVGHEFIPITAFWESWDNSHARFSFLYHAIRSNSGAVNFARLSSRAILTADNLPFSGNSAAVKFGELCTRPWNNLDLFESVLTAAAEKKIEIAGTLFNAGFKSDPEIFFIGCVHLLPFRNPLHELTLAKLNQAFLEAGSRGLFPLSVNWALDSASLLAGFRWSLQEDPKYLSLVLNACEALQIISAVYYSSDFLISLPLMCLAHRRELINLKHWLEDKCTDALPAIFSDGIKLLKSSIAGHIPDKASATECDVLTSETAAIFFRVFETQHLTGKNLEDLNSTKAQFVSKVPGFEKILSEEEVQKLFFFKYPPDIEEEASGYFEQLYSGEWKTIELIELLIKHRTSPQPRNHVLYACATALLFEEYHHFENYPDSELETTAVLFGLLINQGVFTFSLNRMGIGCVLSGLEEGASENYFKFSIKALAQIKNRISHIPELVEALNQHPNVLKKFPEFRKFIGNNSPEKGSGIHHNKLEVTQPSHHQQSSLQPTLEVNDFTQKEFVQPPPPTFEKPQQFQGTSNPTLGGVNLDTLLSSRGQADLVPPNRDAEKKLIFIVNNLSTLNVEEKSKELRAVLDHSMYRYFSHYIVVKRISTEPNQHPIYLQLFDLLNDSELSANVLEETYYNIGLLIRSDKTLVSAQERGLLKSLGSWLGYITLAKNRPILHNKISFKDLLLKGYITQRLIVVIPFTCKVLAQGRLGDVFKPPNPWLMAVIRFLVELSKSPGLKTNTGFEIEMLIRAFGMKPDEIQPTVLLKSIPQHQVQNANPLGRTDVAGANARVEAQPYLEDEGFNLADKVYVDPSLQFGFNPHLREIIVKAVRMAISVVAEGTVARSVAIASFITRDIVTKDFAMEPDERKLRRAAHQMGQVVAGAFAHATCKDHLRKAIIDTLKSYLSKPPHPWEPIKQEDCELIASDNLRLGVHIIQSIASDGALDYVDKVLHEAINNRKKSRERNNQPFYDMAVYSSDNYPTNLPDILKIKPHGLQPVQMQVYEEFAHLASEVHEPPNQEQMAEAYRHQQLAGAQNNSETAESDFAKAACSRLITEFDHHIALAHSANGQSSNNSDLQSIYNEFVALITRFVGQDFILNHFAQRFVSRAYHTRFSLGQQLYAILLEYVTKFSTSVRTEVRNWLIYNDDERKFNAGVFKFLIGTGVIPIEELDLYLSKLLDQNREHLAVFILKLLQRCLLEEPVVATIDSFCHTIAGLTKLSRRTKHEDLRGYIDELNLLLEPRFQEHDLKAKCIFYHSEWIRIYQLPSTVDKDHFDFVNKLTQHGILQNEEKMCMFVRTCIQITMDIYGKQLADNSTSGQSPYHTVDALAKMIVVIIRYAQDEADGYHHSVKVGLFTNILTVISLMLVNDHQIMEHKFNPKPYSRLFSSIVYNMHTHEAHLKPIEINLLFALNNSLSSLQPDFLPGFGFAWMALISHRLFLPRMMDLPNRKGWDYMRAQFANLFKFLGTILTPPISLVGWEFYQGVHRLIAVMVHDYPEFVVAYHFGLMAELPLCCVQVRNMLSSGSPRHLKCPPPSANFFQSKAKPEFLQPPPMLTNFTAPLEAKSLLDGLTSYMTKREPANFLSDLKLKLYKDDDVEEYDLLLINCLILYIAVTDLELHPDANLKNKTTTMEIYHQLLISLEPDGRHIFLNFLFNHLRYPNLHTCYFTMVILNLFSETPNSFLKEQIARVLMDRALVSLPIPWGVWSLLIELYENPKYNFLNQDFIVSAPELVDQIERRISTVKNSASSSNPALSNGSSAAAPSIAAIN